jgi:hypothetical protein
VPVFLLNFQVFWHVFLRSFSHRFFNAFFTKNMSKLTPKLSALDLPFSTFFEVVFFCGILVDFGFTFGAPLSLFGLILVPFWLELGPFWCHVGPDFGYFAPSGCSFWLVVGEIKLLRQYFAKKYTCIDLASNFLQIFRMQIIFPRPGGGTIAAGNRDSPPGRVRPTAGACWPWKCLRFTFPACTLSPQ